MPNRKDQTNISSFHAASHLYRFTLIELLVKTACLISSDSAVEQGMRYERGEMR